MVPSAGRANLQDRIRIRQACLMLSNMAMLSNTWHCSRSLSLSPSAQKPGVVSATTININSEHNLTKVRFPGQGKHEVESEAESKEK